MTEMLVLEKLREFSADTSQSRCNLCSNTCQLTVTRFLLTEDIINTKVYFIEKGIV
ncbi:BadF/BadG/BcrA/BcrD family ATPase, partial [Listeria innocua FSL J1-023]